MNAERIKALHSRYNPQAEAERYINSLSLGENIRYFILIEPGLGYIAVPLKKKYPDAKIISLHAGEQFEGQPGLTEAINSQWFPATGLSIQDFLEREIPDTEASQLRLLEWRPALAVYGKAYITLVEEAAIFIKRSDANARTIKSFGKRWFRNFFNNLTLLRNVICPGEGNVLALSQPLLITGAGPALEEIIPRIKNEWNRNSFFILAASSSVLALKAQGLTPDMLISTDGSGWAKLHLYEFFRSAETRKKTSTLAAALIAALPSQCENLPLLLISDGSFWQTILLTKFNVPFITLPQRGTVSATALDLAFTLTNDDVFFAGMDLGNQDIRSHSRPYSFDRLIDEKATRLNPAYCQSYNRSSKLKAGGSYAVYASWFEKQLSSYPKRLHSLGNNNSLFSSLEATNVYLKKMKKIPAKAANFKSINLNPEGNLGRKALAFLQNVLKDPLQTHQSKILEDELKTLLFPGTTISKNDLVKALEAAAGFGCGKNE